MTLTAKIPAFKDPSVLRRFWANVDRRGPDECWPWKGAIESDGYARFRAHGRKIPVHRFSLQVALDRELTADRLALHDPKTCRRRDCSNPEHLRDGSPSENMLDKLISGTHVHARKTTCPSGHQYDVKLKRGGRRCSVCHAAGELNRRARRLDEINARRRALHAQRRAVAQ